MGKLLGILVLLALVAGALYYFANQSETTAAAPKDGPVKVEEKYGVTTETGGK